MNIILICTFTIIFSSLTTLLTRQLAVNFQIMDIPNERSAHVIPRPRGGGIGIIIPFLLAVFWMWHLGRISHELALPLVVGGLIISVTGYMDDIYRLKTRTRLLIHMLCAACTVYWLGGFNYLDLGQLHLNLQFIGSLLAVIGVVWCTNLYNFMDGIDGLAGSEGIFVALVSGSMLALHGHVQLALLLWLLAAAITGFTIFNWPPAKIFLGDVGSGFLGYVFAVFAIYCANHQLLSIPFWAVILAVFLCDATFTLIHRVINGKLWYVAHADHAYQRVRAYVSHLEITLTIIAINVWILLPLAILCLLKPAQSLYWISIALCILFLIWMMITLRDEK